ncbi:MAG TPA: O-methyltransferase [candidate division Zixibacteria bacterium]|nr:O-methyltransferase [candidate division Zixibacteria bacterium]
MTDSETLQPVHEKIEAYMDGLLKKYDEEVLLEMEGLAKKHGFPIVGRVVGNFLHVLAKSIGARTIFEFGSGFGYSAYWFSLGMDGGELILTDGSKSNISVARQYLSRLPRSCRFQFHAAWAQDVFKETSGDFDIVYNDADKGDYVEIWELARERIRPGGYYIADNVLWYGRVVAESVEHDIEPGWTETIKEHNSLIFDDAGFDAFINPTRDGVVVARRK